MREYYIRREGDEDSSGPFDLDQISSLMEAGKLDADAYFYDIETETWKPIATNEEMMDTLFPKKRKLSLRTAEVEAQRRQEEQAQRAREAEAAAQAATLADDSAADATSEDAASETAAPGPAAKAAPEKPVNEASKAQLRKEPPEKPERIEVTRMLAIAEGRAEDSSGKTPRERRAAAAYFGLLQLTVFFLASAFALIALDWDLALSANAVAMAKSPYLLLAVFDLLVAVVLLLQVTEIYPLIRFRAAIGLGMLTLFFYASGDPLLLASNASLTIAMYAASALVRMQYLFVTAALGLIGLAGYSYVLFLR